MVHINYKKKNNYPQDRELILFDRNAFQSLSVEEFEMVKKKYNILCPQVFIMECIAPERASQEVQASLLKKLKLIENPIILTGYSNTSPVIDIPYNTEYLSILTSEQIVKNCIMSKPIAMERVPPEKLISHYKPRIEMFKEDMKAYTETCEVFKGSLTMNWAISSAEELYQQTNKEVPSRQEIKNDLRRNERTHITQQLDYAAREALQGMRKLSVNDVIVGFNRIFSLTDRESRRLRDQIQDGKILTIENYPDLAYPIYIYYLVFFMLYARQHDTQHLDQSYVRDFRYFHYLNFCDRFIGDETSTPNIVNSFPYGNIRKTHIMTSNELKDEL